MFVRNALKEQSFAWEYLGRPRRFALAERDADPGVPGVLEPG